MKNREKYADEIKNFKGDICKDFIKPIILKSDDCRFTVSSCEHCRMLREIWFEEEYIEPEVDWSKVAVDTPILVRKSKENNWEKRYFSKYENGAVFAWLNGKTSWSVNNEFDYIKWNYAKLAEDGDM